MATLTFILLLSCATDPGDLATRDRQIETVTGTGEKGDGPDGGQARAAALNHPFDVALDAAGNLYFSDTGNHRIRRVDASTGIVTTIAGNGRKGYSGDGGPATAAMLNEPYGLAIDGNGETLFFADRLNRRVRKIDLKAGTIKTVAGDGSERYTGDGGAPEKAGLVEPNGVALAGSNRLYIADVAGHRVRVVNRQQNEIATFVGNGVAAHSGDGGPHVGASVHGPRAVKVGSDGSVYILEREGNRLRKVDAKTGVITTVAGTGKAGYAGDGGPAAEALLNGPKEMALDRDGNVLIVDTENNAIRLVSSAAGTIATIAGMGNAGGTGDGGPATSAQLDRPHGVAVGPDGSIYIGDTNNHRIRRIAP
jgi:sugar lactone lactonase YvrE